MYPVHFPSQYFDGRANIQILTFEINNATFKKFDIQKHLKKD